jgi:predicted DNA-binding protein
MKQIGTHVLVTYETKQRLDQFCLTKHRTQADVLREATDKLIVKHQKPVTYNGWDSGLPKNVSIVFRLTRKQLLSVRAISQRTRVSRSVLFREAIADILETQVHAAPTRGRGA